MVIGALRARRGSDCMNVSTVGDLMMMIMDDQLWCNYHRMRRRNGHTLLMICRMEKLQEALVTGFCCLVECVILRANAQGNKQTNKRTNKQTNKHAKKKIHEQTNDCYVTGLTGITGISSANGQYISHKELSSRLYKGGKFLIKIPYAWYTGLFKTFMPPGEKERKILWPNR